MRLRPATDPWLKAGSGYSAKNIGFKGIEDNSPNMSAPRFQSFSAFGEEIVALIDGCDARNRACLVVQNFVSDVRSDT